MMGDQLVTQECLFHQFRLEDHVPADHMLRANAPPSNARYLLEEVPTRRHIWR